MTSAEDDAADRKSPTTSTLNTATTSDLAGASNSRASGGMRLAQHFIDLLIEEANTATAPNLKTQGVKEGSFSHLLIDDGDDENEEDEPAATELSVDLIVAATRLARAMDSAPGLIQAIRQQSPIVVIETGAAATHADVQHVLKTCVLGRAAKIVAPAFYDTPTSQLPDRTAVIFERKEAIKLGDAEQLDKRLARALQSADVVVGVAADAQAQLPPDLVRAADYRVRLDRFDREMIEFVIAAITRGTPTAVVDEKIVREVELSDLRIALRGSREANRSIARLTEVVEKRRLVSESTPRLEDLDGYGEAKTIGLAIVADLAFYRAGQIPWSAVDRGLLLAGPPGTGKTTFAKAMAKSAGLPLIAGSLTQWQAAREGHLGHLLAAMRGAFAEAKRKAPSILFIDEVDSFGDRASFDNGNKDYSTQVVNGFLECLDGIDGREGIVTVGATNRPSAIDPAITRAGRLDRIVFIPLPDVEALVKILRFHLKDDVVGADLASAAIAARGSSGADCETFVRRARGEARRAGRALTLDALIAVIRDGRVTLPAPLRERIAIHEAGHAVVAVAFGLGEPQALTIHDTGGSTHVTAEPRAMTAADIVTAIAQLLAGREAELLLSGEATAGAGGRDDSDLARATKLAVALEGSFGLGSFGSVWLGDPDQLLDRPWWPWFGARVDEVLRHAASQARRALIENRAALERLAKALFETSYLDSAQIRAVTGSIRTLKMAQPPNRPDKPHKEGDPSGQLQSH
jgi:AAA+ superfamily predicted ATPase